MNTIEVNTPTPYNVIVGNDLLSRCGDYFANRFTPCKIAIITDDIVDSLYAKTLKGTLEKNNFQVVKIVFPHGESSKNIENLTYVLECLAQEDITRSDLIVALGGGVVGDLAGFAAAVYQRGVRYVQIPTTFLAAVDSSVGGKTAIDLKHGKNLAGVFWQPQFVICDCSLLKTLPEVYFSDGVSETIKYAMAFDRELFLKLGSSNWKNDLESVISRCIKLKASVVEKDVFDNGERQKLNFGHTIGHAIEIASDYKITHGHAVAIGMVMMTRIALTQNLVNATVLQSLIGLLKLNHLPTACDYSLDTLTKAALSDKKRRGNQITLIVPRRIGSCETISIKAEHLYQWFQMGM